MLLKNFHPPTYSIIPAIPHPVFYHRKILVCARCVQICLWQCYLGGFFCLFFVYLFVLPFRAAPLAYGSSQARGRIRALAAGLPRSHSNAGSEPHPQPTLQLTATPDSQTTEQGQGLNPHLHRYYSDSFPLRHNGNSYLLFFKS